MADINTSTDKPDHIVNGEQSGDSTIDIYMKVDHENDSSSIASSFKSSPIVLGQDVTKLKEAQQSMMLKHVPPDRHFKNENEVTLCNGVLESVFITNPIDLTNEEDNLSSSSQQDLSAPSKHIYLKYGQNVSGSSIPPESNDSGDDEEDMHSSSQQDLSTPGKHIYSKRGQNVSGTSVSLESNDSADDEYD